MSHYYASSHPLQKSRHKKCRDFFLSLLCSLALSVCGSVWLALALSLWLCPSVALALSVALWLSVWLSLALALCLCVSLCCVLRLSTVRRLCVCLHGIASLYGQNRGQWWLVDKPVDTTQSDGVIHNRTDVRLSVMHKLSTRNCG